MTTTARALWAGVADVVARHGGNRRAAFQSGNRRRYTVPTGRARWLSVEIRLGVRWCDIGIDRMGTDVPRPPDSGDWFRAHLHRLIESGWGGGPPRHTWAHPGNGPHYAWANAVHRDVLLAVLDPWIAQERRWSAEVDDDALRRWAAVEAPYREGSGLASLDHLLTEETPR